VRNEKGHVRIQIQGQPEVLERFHKLVFQSAPVTSSPHLISEARGTPTSETGFEILPSLAPSSSEIHVPADFYLCPECLEELMDPANRRHAYPFINCTACGPRYTIIRALPYDRTNTSMAEFHLCPECRQEYSDPMNRRFHAEPIACPECGPQLSFDDGVRQLSSDAALDEAVEALQRGEIILIKGIGGYHLCCDATNDEAINQLRRRKRRPDKPFAIMFPVAGDDNLDQVSNDLIVDSVAADSLRSPARPIVLLPRRDDSQLPSILAPGMNELGVMLPYSPLHHLLLARLGKPVVATSANLTGEPVMTEADEVNRRLGHITQVRLHHNRPIVRPADDPVLRPIQGQARPLRLGRGTAPLELPLPGNLSRPLLACGGHMKNTIALARDKRVIISPHIGDLDAPRSRQIYAEVIADFQRLYDITPEALVCDAHPDYYSSRWAREQRLPVTTVLHHHAHASSVAGEYPEQDNWLVFTWDGVGLGPDRLLWGGEALYGKPGDWQRVASWRPFYLPGGERAAREPWRSALALCWDAGQSWPEAPDETGLLYEAWQKRMNSPGTSAVGRLFDAAAALIGLCHSASFEGQAPMQLEQLANQAHHSGIELPLYRDNGELWRSDWIPLLDLLQDETLTPAQRAYGFHRSLSRALLAQVRQLREEYGEFAIGLSGGVFQNRLLCDLVMQECQQRGWPVYLPRQVPVNDAGLCYGQVIEMLAREPQNNITA
jgi:hydrogenase maturation protein HypF